jgi:hypothetical protein
MCPVDEIGKNSVRPSTMAIMMLCIKVIAGFEKIALVGLNKKGDEDIAGQIIEL